MAADEMIAASRIDFLRARVAELEAQLVAMDAVLAGQELPAELFAKVAERLGYVKIGDAGEASARLKGDRSPPDWIRFYLYPYKRP